MNRREPPSPPSDAAPARAVALRGAAQGQAVGAAVTASGDGLVAQRIIDLAREAGVPLYQDPELVRLLSELDLGVELPHQLHAAVAEVISFVWELDEASPSTEQSCSHT